MTIPRIVANRMFFNIFLAAARLVLINKTDSSIVAIGPWGAALWETERGRLQTETRACMRLLRGFNDRRNRDSRVGSTRPGAGRPLGSHLYARWSAGYE